MNKKVEYSLHDEIAELKKEISQLSKALEIIYEIDDYHQSLVYDTLFNVGYYENETESEDI
jgi:hypothetical protein